MLPTKLMRLKLGGSVGLMSKCVIKIELSLNEALVLSEFVDRYTNTDQLTIEDQAEQRVLWNIVAN